MMHFEQLIQLLESCLSGHDCQNEKELIDLAITISLICIREKRKIKPSPDLDELHNKFADFKHINDFQNQLTNTHYRKSELGSIKPQLELKIRKQSPIFYGSYNRELLKPLGWGLGLDRLPILHEGLFNLSYIDCDLDKFIPHFYNNGTKPEPQIWKGTGIEYINFFDLLINKRVIRLSPEGYVQRICYHFTDENGKFFKPRSLSASKSKINSLTLSNFKDLIKKVRPELES